MRLPRRFSSTTWLLAIPSLGTAITIDCSHVRVDRQSFDLSALSGPHSVHVTRETPPSVSNTTYTIDICKPLRKLKDVDDKYQCHTGARVCGIEYDYPAEGKHYVREVRDIAGDFIHEGRPLDPKWSRLKNPESDSEEPIGLRLELNGGRFPFNSKGQQQKAVVAFICDLERTGLEGDEPDDRPKKSADGEEEGVNVKRRTVSSGGEDDEGDDTKARKRKSLEFVSYKTDEEDDIGVLRLKWRTKYACEGLTEHEPGPKKSNHWGFFTWFIIIVFLAIATYLIFGSWLNYNRYGARGWDLLPHGDTIRDVPYLLKDWARRVVNTVQGGGSRGGYSAV